MDSFQERGLGHDHLVGSSAFRNPRRFYEAAKALIDKLWAEGNVPGRNTPIPPDPAAFQRFAQEVLEKKIDSAINKLNYVVKRVEFAVETTVKNQSHINRIESGMKSIEESISHILKNTEDALRAAQENRMLTLQMKAQLEAELKAFREMNEKSAIQKFDGYLTDIETAAEFPGRILSIVEKIFLFLEFLDVLIYLIGTKEPKPQLVEVKEVIEVLPEKCVCTDPYIARGRYSDILKQSLDLLHKGYEFGLHFQVSADATFDARHLSGAGVFGSDSMASIGNWDIVLRSCVDPAENLVRPMMELKNAGYSGLNASVCVPLPWSSVEGKVQYLHDYGWVQAGCDVNGNPVGNLSCIFGGKAFSCGFDVSFGGADKAFTKYDGAVRWTKSGIDATVRSSDRNDKVVGSLSYRCDRFGVGVENSYTISTRVNKLLAGVSFAFNPMTMIKGRVGVEGRLAQDDKIVDMAAQVGVVLLHQRGSFCAGLAVETTSENWKAPRAGITLRFGYPKFSA